MLPRLPDSLWMPEDGGDQEQGQGQEPPSPAMGLGMLPPQGQEEQNLLAMAAAAAGNGGFQPQSVLVDDWFLDAMASGAAGADAQGQLLLPHPAPGAGTVTVPCAGSQMFSMFNMGGAAPFDVQGFDLGLSGGGDLGGLFLGSGNASLATSLSLFPAGNAAQASQLSLLNPGFQAQLGSFAGFGTAPAHMPEFGGFDMFDAGGGSSSTAPAPLASMMAPFSARGKPAMLRPLEIFPPVGAQPTLFQKRALRRNAGEEEDDRKRKAAEDAAMAVGASSGGGGDTALDDADDDGVSMDASVFNYDSGEDGKGVEESGKKDAQDCSNTVSTVTGAAAAADGKGKRKGGLPAKNLMAERRRRKKLNDRLYMLRSVVPKISKMDRASILGDAIEYLKELMQKINDLQNELEQSPSAASLPPTPTSFHPPTPTLPTLPPRVKEEPCPSSLPSPTTATAQQPRVEVRVREGRAVNIHMFCARRPGLLLSAMRAIEALGLDVQQAVVSCFNGFSLDVFKAEVGKDVPAILPDEIKAVLLQCAGLQGVN